MKKPPADVIDNYPVGVCVSERCFYPEPHRHGLDCDKICECAGVGAVTSPLYDEGGVMSCDWGGCNREAVARRQSYVLDTQLPVCSWHAGWDDYQYLEGVTP